MKNKAGYDVWRGMMRRCHNRNDPAYPAYGGRGIRVCKRWHSFVNFLDDMGARPPGLTIDRIDNDKGYYPDNCRWATRAQQANNRPTWCRLLTFRGETMNLSEWARRYGLQPDALSMRLKRGMSLERALSQPLWERLYSHKQQTRSLNEWASITGISRKTLWGRIHKQGWPIDRALTEPLEMHRR